MSQRSVHPCLKGAEDLESAAEAAAASAESLSFLERKQQVDVALKGQVGSSSSLLIPLICLHHCLNRVSSLGKATPLVAHAMLHFIIFRSRQQLQPCTGLWWLRETHCPATRPKRSNHPKRPRGPPQASWQQVCIGSLHQEADIAPMHPPACQMRTKASAMKLFFTSETLNICSGCVFGSSMPVGGLPADSGRKRPASGSGRMTMSELAAAVEKELGYSLRVAPSGIDHEEAGSGLWLDGKAAPGSVVAFYPGVTYNKDQYR